MELNNEALAQILPWALGLAVGFPLVMVALGELGAHAEQAGWPSAPTLRGVRRLVAPGLALLLFLRHILQRPADDTLTQLTTSIFWFLVLYLVLAFVNQVVFGAAPPDSRRSRIPALVRDLVRFLLVGLGAALIYSYVWGRELSAAWTALGLGSVVIGLALQEPLGNIVSGLILLAERPFALGDWIHVDGMTGKVVEINWRSVHLVSSSREMKVVPNSTLYRGSYNNFSRPTKIRTHTVELLVDAEFPPNRVKAVFLGVLDSVPGVLREPRAQVELIKLGEPAATYHLTFTVARQEDLDGIRDTLLTRTWYAARRNRLRLSSGHRAPHGWDSADTAETKPTELLRAFPQFRLGEGFGDDLDGGLRLRCYGAGEPIVREGGPQDGLYLVLSGEAVVTVRDRLGVEREIGRVGRGEFFGENAMVAGQPGDTTVTAVEDLDLLVMDPAALQKLLDQSPRLAQELGQVLDTRRKAVLTARGLRLSAH